MVIMAITQLKLDYQKLRTSKVVLRDAFMIGFRSIVFVFSVF
jgi:hypothetical protein